MTPLLVSSGINSFHVETKPGKRELGKKYALFSICINVLFIDMFYLYSESM